MVAHTHTMGEADQWHVVRCTVCGLAASLEYLQSVCVYPVNK